MNCGLLGEKLPYSYSPQIHSMLGDYRYSLFEIDPNNLQSFLETADFHGLNVTIPYKKAVIPFCAKLSPEAKRLGAVNTIIKQEDGSLYGYNTDYRGFFAMAKRLDVDYCGKKVLVLGSGGASSTVCAVMNELGAQVIVISRNGPDHYGNLEKHADAAVLINTTPVGTYPNNSQSPVELSRFKHLICVMDLTYNPHRTKLIMDAQRMGLKTEDGLWMLVAQAKESAQLFLGHSISDQIVSKIHRALRKQMENIILIGMPGCGKTTVGKILASLLKKEFIDTDQWITENSEKSIPEIFADGGENSFRQLETAALEQIGKQSGLVIATGGGCVTREENYPLLYQNGRIVWIYRDPNYLPTSGRPLSKGRDLKEMYRIRKPMYERFAHLCVNSCPTPTETAKLILQRLYTEENS